MKKTIGITATVAFMAVILVTTYFKLFAVEKRVATLTSVKGAVTVVPAATPGQSKAAANNMVANEGDTIRTGGGSSVIIKFDDGSMAKLGPIAQMKLGKIAGKGKTNNTQLNVGSGKVWARVNKLNRDSTFEVKTPTAVAGVRGTYYSSEVDTDATSKFDVFDGEVAVAAVGNPSKQTLVKANQTTTVAQGKAPTPPATMPKAVIDKEKEGFSQGEVTASAFDVQVSANPPSISAGGKSVVTVKVLRNGQPLSQAVPVRLKLGGTATFVSTGAAEADVTTNANGIATLEITAASAESITVDVSIRMQVKKKKNS